jgi:hypothetical protein
MKRLLISILALAAATAPLHAAEWTVSSQQGLGLTAGASKGDYFIGFVCRPGSIGVAYLVPGGEVDKAIGGLKNLDIAMTVDGTATHSEASPSRFGSRTGFIFAGDVGNYWAGKAYRARATVKIALADDSSGKPVGAHNVTVFSASGIKAAIDQFLVACPSAGRLLRP